MTEAEYEKNKQHIADLSVLPSLAPERTGWEQFRHVMVLVSAAFSAVAITLTMWLFYQKSQTADCLNAILGDRTNSSDQQLNAQIASLQHMSDLVTADPANSAAALAKFRGQTSDEIVALKGIQAYRVAHPLGRC